jgi:hypothetical protein
MRQQELPLEVEELRQRLRAAQDALRAIRAGRPDIPAVKDGDDPYRSLHYLAAMADASDGAITGVRGIAQDIGSGTCGPI